MILSRDIALQRLASHRLIGSPLDSPEAVVGWFGAVQSQDYAGASWALGLRSRGLTQAAVDAAFDAGRILRTHVLRPTWHFVLPEDARLLLDLTGPRVQAGTAGRRRQLELDGGTVAAAEAAFAAALEGGRTLTRRELGGVVAEAGISPEGQRLPHLIMSAELDGLIISGPRRGRDFTYALLSERSPRLPRLPRDEALGRLAWRYFRSHGPAQARDLAWWAGLPLADVRAAIAASPEPLEKALIGGADHYAAGEAGEVAAASASAVHLLPNFDELTVGYRDRSALAGARFDPSIFSFGSVLANVLTVGGRVRGAWRRTAGRRSLRIEIRLLAPLRGAERREVERAVAELGRFAGLATEAVWL